ncbi:hypothetical protein [Maricaulis sp. CAU 1757]
MRLLTTLTSSALCLAALAPAAFANNAEAVFGERELALNLDARCNLFSEAERKALDASRLQARGTLLRGGTSTATLEAKTTAIRDQAARLDCQAPVVADMADRVGSAYAAWMLIQSAEFPGDTFGWNATRFAYPGVESWALYQDTGSLRVGMSVLDERMRLTLALPDAEPRATAAVLVLRDLDRAPDLYDPTVGGIFAGPADAQWARWTPPAYAKTLNWARGRGDRASVTALTGDADGSVFYFSESAAEALALRDPREAARIELLDRRGEVIAVHHFEVGDFGAGLAFLEASQWHRLES